MKLFVFPDGTIVDAANYDYYEIDETILERGDVIDDRDSLAHAEKAGAVRRVVVIKDEHVEWASSDGAPEGVVRNLSLT